LAGRHGLRFFFLHFGGEAAAVELDGDGVTNLNLIC
jgi:hypothetical protein